MDALVKPGHDKQAVIPPDLNKASTKPLFHVKQDEEARPYEHDICTRFSAHLKLSLPGLTRQSMPALQPSCFT